MNKQSTTLCVAGGSGLVGSNIVKTALAAGYRVNATLRDASDNSKTRHLQALPGASERLTLFSAEMTDTHSFDEAMAGADGVFIASLAPRHSGPDGTPASEMDDEQGWRDIIRPTADGCLAIMQAAARAGTANVVICSSTSSTNPPEPIAVKNELDAVSDAEEQMSRKKYTAAEKTVMEREAKAFAADNGQRLVILLPTFMLGPTVLPQHLERGLHASLAAMVEGRKGQHETVPNGSASMAHIHDVAALFLAAYEQSAAEGRYFAVYDSWTWADIYAALAPHVPEAGLPAPLTGSAEEPTQFDFTRRDSLGVTFRDIPTTLAQTVDWIKQRPFG
ncbi:NAD-dependent epimerase/dehydratase family protein [Halomonas sp. M20]|uniref:NAD-dependent epimerase/dehydratase family protein n=1 Tax=Halomonas sp. M20 TaxID=2763264 RepID=UPI001D0A9C5E|nr:NAD-dependent epimerase/dehydratase family protein [Halomonas sp. M20]